MPIPLAAILAPGAIKAGLGLGQLIGGASMKTKRPEYTTPKEQGESLALARQMAFARDPGAQQQLAETAQGGATALSRLQKNAGSQGQILSGLAGIQASTNAAARGILANEASDRFRRVANLQRSLGLMSQYKDKEFDINEMQPYQDKARTKAALVGGGLQNLFSGAGDVSSGYLSNEYNKQLFEMLKGN